AYLSGMSIATLVGAAVALVASFIVYRNLPASLRAPAPIGEHEREPERAPVSEELSILNVERGGASPLVGRDRRPAAAHRRGRGEGRQGATARSDPPRSTRRGGRARP